MNPNLKVAAAVAAILSSAGAAHAQTNGPTPTAAQNGIALYISGSSAARGAVLQVLETGSVSGAPVLCGGNAYSIFSSTPDPNFYALSCIPAASAGLASPGSVYTVWYRAEGGSVTGALPLVSGSTVNQLTLNANVATTATGYAVTIGGNATGNGLNDSFTNVFEAPVQLGITDVEPGALVKQNYPSAYSPAVFGKATAAQLGALTGNGAVIFDQVFGIFANVKSGSEGSAFSGAQQAGAGQGSLGTPSGLAVSAQTLATILQGKVKDWSKVPTAGTGVAVTTNSAPITIVNREQGSGSRTATDIFFTNDHCSVLSSTLPISSTASNVYPTEYFSTADVLANANTIPGAITYASIDQAGSKFPNLTLVAVDGVQPTNLAAATGQYGDWFEAWALTNPNVTGDAATLSTNLVAALQVISTLGVGQNDLLATPLNETPSLPIASTSTGSSTTNPIYITPYTRNGNSCSDPASAL